MLPISCGVPQGSILGPLLFISYINDALSAMTRSRIQFYADDTIIYADAESPGDAAAILQPDLNRFAKWFTNNVLTINKKKIKSMVFGTRAKVKRAKDIRFKIDGVDLQMVPSYKYLGVVLDSTLTYSNHISTTLGTISHKLYVLGKVRRYLTPEAALQIFNSMILPYFDYADVVYAKSFKCNLEKLQRAQNKALKACLRLDPRTETDDVHSIAKVSLLQNRRQADVNNFLYQRQTREDLLNTTSVCTRSHDALLFKVAKPNLEAYKRRIGYFGAVQWNALPPNIRNIKNHLAFKNTQKKWMRMTIT